MLLIKAIFYTSLTSRYIFQLTQCKHKGVSESIDSDEMGFSSVGFAE